MIIQLKLIIKFQDCGEYQNIKSPSTKIKINKKFAQYWKNIEKRFNCVGFCQTIYYHNELGETVPFTKYLFSGFNRGPIKHKGCFRLLMNWIIKALISFGSLRIAGSLIQIGIVFIGINMLKEGENENDNDYKNQDDNHEKKVNENSNEKEDNNKKEDNENSNKNNNKLIQKENEQNNN